MVDSSPLAPTVLKFFDEFFEDDSRPKLAVDSLIREIVQWSFDQCDFALKNHDEQPSATEKTIESVVRMIDTFGPRLFHDADFTKVNYIDIRRTTKLTISSIVPFFQKFSSASMKSLLITRIVCSLSPLHCFWCT